MSEPVRKSVDIAGAVQMAAVPLQPGETKAIDTILNQLDRDFQGLSEGAQAAFSIEFANRFGPRFKQLRAKHFPKP